jgi:uncharacterized protein (DUF1499 family)
MKPSLLPVAVGGLALLMLAGAGPLYQLGLLPLTWAFGLMRWAAYVGVAAMLGALVVGALAYRQKARLGMLAAAAALVMGLVAFGIPYQWQRQAQSLPPIHDITTDLQNPPVFKAIVPLRGDAPNTLDRSPQVADQQRRGYPDIAPVTLPIPPDQVFEEALLAAQEAEWQIADADKQAGRIEATDSTPWFGFKDDIVVRLTPWGSGTRVDVRSVSRIGLSDVGTNARRIKEFLGQLEK